LGGHRRVIRHPSHVKKGRVCRGQKGGGRIQLLTALELLVPDIKDRIKDPTKRGKKVIEPATEFLRSLISKINLLANNRVQIREKKSKGRKSLGREGGERKMLQRKEIVFQRPSECAQGKKKGPRWGGGGGETNLLDRVLSHRKKFSLTEHQREKGGCVSEN